MVTSPGRVICVWALFAAGSQFADDDASGAMLGAERVVLDGRPPGLLAELLLAVEDMARLWRVNSEEEKKLQQVGKMLLKAECGIAVSGRVISH